MPPYHTLLYHPGYTTILPCAVLYCTYGTRCGAVQDDEALGSRKEILLGERVLRCIEASILLRLVGS